MSNKEIKTVLIGFSLILFTSLYYNISKSNASTTADNIQAVVSIITLIVSIITIYFVYKAYQSQKDQLAMQGKEIKRLTQEGEFNRLLDITYKQIEHSNNRIKENTRDFEIEVRDIYTIEDTYKNLPKFKWVFTILLEEYSFYDNLFTKSNQAAIH